MILLTGPTGNTGRELVKLLRNQGVPFVCMARREAARQELEAEGLEVVYGDFADLESLRSALQGISKAYLVCTPDDRLVELECNFIKAAAAAGVGYIVKLSALLAAHDAPTPNLRFHAQVEEELERSSVPFAVIRPTGFMQTTYWMNEQLIRQKGIMAYPAADGEMAVVDVRDVAAAAAKLLTAKLLTTKGHEGKFYDVTGSEALSFAEMASILSEALGRPIAYVNIQEEEMAGTMRELGVAEVSVQHVVGVFRLVREGKLSFVTQSLSDLGIVPRTFAEFAADLARGATASATSFKPPGAA